MNTTVTVTDTKIERHQPNTLPAIGMNQAILFTARNRRLTRRTAWRVRVL